MLPCPAAATFLATTELPSHVLGWRICGVVVLVGIDLWYKAEAGAFI
jgi:hypothetical protein